MVQYKIKNVFCHINHLLNCFLIIIFLIASVKTLDAFETPKDFLWGVANASFQVEGTPADSDWSRWTHTEGKIADKSTADVATDFWNRYEEDIILAEKLGLRFFVFRLLGRGFN